MGPGRVLRTATFNIKHGRSAAGRVDVPLLVHACAGLAADVLALQEVDVGAVRSRRVDQAAAVAEALGLAHVFGPARSGVLRGRYGNALCVRGEISDAEVVKLPHRPSAEPRAALVASVVVDGLPLSVAATHLSVHPDEALIQLDTALAAILARPSPRLLLGDLNLRPPDIDARLRAAGLALAAGPPTFPAAAPRIRIDHVAADGVTIGGVEVPETEVSDHRPLIVALEHPG